MVLSLKESSAIEAKKNHVFKQTGAILEPKLWYPAWSPYGKPYMYKVYSCVRVDGKLVDRFESPLGIRTITWDQHYPSINGKKHLFWGFGQRYEYPGLGSAVPEEQQWRDIRLMTEAGGRFVRPGHCASSPETVAACDAYGVMMAQPSGDDEFVLQRAGQAMATLKKELHRDLIVRDRNHPSILMWEDDNGGNIKGLVADLVKITEEWDGIHPRMNSPRDQHGKYPGEIIPGKTVLGQCNAGRPIEIMKDPSAPEGTPFPTVPTWNAESWVTRDARHHWETEKSYAAMWYTRWRGYETNGKIFAYAHWYLAETQGEDCNTLIGVDDPQLKAAMQKDLAGQQNQARVVGRSLGCSAMCGNRIPKLIYRIWQNALWIPYEQRPGVTLQSHWNLSGTVEVNAWSNCPSVELFLNGKSMGIQKPNSSTGICRWASVAWEPGTLRAEGKDAAGKTVCSDQRISSGQPHHIVLSVEPPLKRPDGVQYEIQANGSDAGFILATVVDENGNWCPLADNNITFTTSGPGVYRGSYNFWATPGKPLGYHAPGDPELQAEGGMIKVAVRSTFQPGEITVSASSPGLGSGTAKFTTK